jgi:glucose-6-phosphate dehydrogenase assembly protein OpcA
MATPAPSSDAFLSGQGIPVALSDVEDELARLWGPAAEREGGPDLDHPTVTRIVLANLVVADLGDDPARVDQLLDTLGARFPSRMIVLRSSASTERKITAEISAVCHLPAPGMPQVCAEQIVLRGGANALDLFPGAVLPLLETDLPFVLWWCGDPRPYQSLFCALADESSRIVLDLPEFVSDLGAVRFALDEGKCHFGRDIAWFGITPWRELTAQFFDPRGASQLLERIESVVVETATPTRGGLARETAWYGGWIAGQLGWKPRRVERPPGALSATFASQDGEPSVTLKSRHDPQIAAPHISSVVITVPGGGTFRLTRQNSHSDDVLVEVDAPTHRNLPRLVHAPEWDAARRVAAAIESARDDTPYQNALPHMLWILDPTSRSSVTPA